MEGLKLRKVAVKEHTNKNNNIEKNKQNKENSSKFANKLECFPSYCGDKTYWYYDATPGCSFWPTPPLPNLHMPLEESHKSSNSSDNQTSKVKPEAKTVAVDRSIAEQVKMDTWMNEYLRSGYRAEIAMLYAERAPFDEYDSDDDICYGDYDDEKQK